MKKDLTKISDLTQEDVLKIINKAFEFKEQMAKTNKIPYEKPLKDKVVAMIFEKPSLRTKVAFEVAAAHLGAIPVFLSSSQILASGNNKKDRESIPDIAKNLEKFADLILARVYNHKTIETIATSISKPVINALCNKHYPTQALTDLMAIMWHKKDCKNLKVAFVGDGNNVATSLMQICAIMGIDFSIASPPGCEIPIEEYKIGMESAYKNDSTIELLSNPKDAVKNADVIYSDTFISMGEESIAEEKIKNFDGYQVNTKLLKLAKDDAVFMHCLPARRGEEVTNEVMDSPQSIVFDQAECLLYVAKALLITYLS